MSENPLNAKAIRQAHTGVEQVQTKQYQLATLLHRIYYKSKAQHRGAKWFQSISGMRKTFVRLLNMQIVKSKMDESLPDRGVFAKNRSKQGDDRSNHREHRSFDALQRAIGQVWSSMWADDRPQDGSLVKYDTLPSKEPDLASCLSTANELLIVCLQLQELANRSKVSFNLLQVHLRTPPAPTFAPLALSLLSLSAQIHSACMEALWSCGEKSNSLASLYLAFRSAGNTETNDSTLVLGGTSRKDKLAIEKTLNKIQSARKGHLEWLPREIVQSARRQEELGLKMISDTKLDETLLQTKLIPDGMEEDEDLGVAV